MPDKKKNGKSAVPAVVPALLAVVALILAGCGGGQAQEPAPVNAEGLKLPPGVVEEGGLPEDAPERVVQERVEVPTQSAAATSAEAVLELEGGRFTLTTVTRLTDNQDVTSAAMREMDGDYLEFELTIENVSDDYLDLTDYEFRVWSPGIDTDDYAWNYPLGRPGGDNLIIATLINQDDLSALTYELKIGEVYEDALLFFDLNPTSVRRNDAFDPEGATFSIYKARGGGAGEKAEVSLSGLVKEG